MIPEDQSSEAADEPRGPDAAEVERDETLEELLGFVRDARGFDFTGYKRTSVSRRVRRRMRELDLESPTEYRELLEADVDEFTALFNTLLINVTRFFRNPPAWRYLAAEIVPEIAARHVDGPADPHLERGMCHG